MEDKKIDKKLQGKQNRARGQRFELKTKKDLEADGWIVDRWSNNVDLEKGTMHTARSRFGSRTTGFPDFVAFKLCNNIDNTYKVMGVECKSAKYLDKIEKAKCLWYLRNKAFGEIKIAYKGKKRGKVEYKSF